MNWSNALNSAGGYWDNQKKKRNCWDFCCAEEPVSRQPQLSIPEGYHSVHSKTKHGKKFWTKDEDKKLSRLAEQYGCDWEYIAPYFAEKTASQLRYRWKNKLDPNLKTKDWTQEEELVLVELLLQVGCNWEKISDLMPGRSPNSIRNKYISKLRYLLTEAEIDQIENKLMSMDVEESTSSNVNGNSTSNKEEHLNTLYRNFEELRSLIDETKSQINLLEKNMYPEHL